MQNLFVTLMIAFVLIVFAIACLAIGWLVTGKIRLEKMCGKDPTKKREGSCDDSVSCDLCSSNDSCTVNEKEDEHQTLEVEGDLEEDKKDASNERR